MMMEEKIADLLVQLLTEKRLRSFSPGFYRYFGRLRSSKEALKYVRHLSNLYKLSNVPIRGKRVIDAGCGYGLTSVVTRLLGAGEVIGIDFKLERVQTFKSYLQELLFDVSGVIPIYGDIARTGLKSECFDAMLVNEAISHYGNTEKFLAEARRLLNVGGIIYVADANNACNPLIQWRNRKIWESFEKGPEGVSVYGHKIEKSMQYQRYEIIKDNFPHLSSQQAQQLSESTSGLWGSELVAAVQDYVDTGRLPNLKYQKGMCPRNPQRGSFVEMVLHPKALKRSMDSMGFKTRIYSHFCGARSNTLYYLNRILAAMTPVTIYGARGFRLVACKY
jgi:2-polyprenyl-3-methyl-5-hydroxy-6-metoxy-1,4-benzoquinol methylase